MAMRYYAGNWPFGVWLFKGESHEKLERLKKTAKLGPRPGRAVLRPRDGDRGREPHGRLAAYAPAGPGALRARAEAVGDQLEDYTWVDGELVCGMVLGYNFGDGHLHDEEFLAAVQEQCGFEDGELRVIMVEGQPLFGKAPSTTGSTTPSAASSPRARSTSPGSGSGRPGRRPRSRGECLTASTPSSSAAGRTGSRPPRPWRRAGHPCSCSRRPMRSAGVCEPAS